MLTLLTLLPYQYCKNYEFFLLCHQMIFICVQDILANTFTKITLIKCQKYSVAIYMIISSGLRDNFIPQCMFCNPKVLNNSA